MSREEDVDAEEAEAPEAEEGEEGVTGVEQSSVRSSATNERTNGRGVTGTEWQVIDVALDHRTGHPAGDGDTVKLIRKRLAQLGDDWFWLLDQKHKPIRLAWVDTPEKGKDGYAQADRDLDEWIAARWGRLRIVCFESAGWDRILGDLIDETGASASQYLMVERGWPAYVK